MSTILVKVGFSLCFACGFALGGCLADPPDKPGDTAGRDCVDEDGDGYGVGEDRAGCGWEDLDCDDSRVDVNPGMQETWYDGLDQDCREDDDFDADGDLHGSDQYGGDDCDDQDASVHPGVEDEPYDGVDQDCDGLYDDGDGDGWESAEYGGDDCDDQDAAVNPAAAEIWYDGIDQDCDGSSDYDQDGDGYDSNHYLGEDCDDTQATVHPGALDYADSVDANCDGEYGSQSLASSGTIIVGDEWMDHLGADLSPAGDLDGDGKDDFLVGAPDAFGSGEVPGAAYLVSGATLGESRVSDVSFVFYGEGADDQAGLAVLGDFDLDGDGLVDMAVGAPWLTEYPESDPRGVVYVSYGPISADMDLGLSDVRILGEREGDWAGWDIAASDLDGDGKDELIIGAVEAFGEVGEAGVVFIMDDPAANVLTLADATARLQGVRSEDEVGCMVAGLQDLDGDGNGDILVGALGTDDFGDDSGTVYLLYGPQVGSVSLDEVISFTGVAAEDNAGYSGADAGDVDGDGHSDFLVGAPYADGGQEDAGQVYLMLGSSRRYDSSTSLADAAAILTGAAQNDFAGMSVAGAGDVDDDGFADILVGAPQGATELLSGNPGYAALVLGPVSGTVTLDEGATLLLGSQGDDRAGTVVSAAGDPDGDGYADFLVTSLFADGEAGLVYLLSGQPR